VCCDSHRRAPGSLTWTERRNLARQRALRERALRGWVTRRANLAAKAALVDEPYEAVELTPFVIEGVPDAAEAVSVPWTPIREREAVTA
jgi:hypothetical protein